MMTEDELNREFDVIHRHCGVVITLAIVRYLQGDVTAAYILNSLLEHLSVMSESQLRGLKGMYFQLPMKFMLRDMNMQESRLRKALRALKDAGLISIKTTSGITHVRINIENIPN